MRAGHLMLTVVFMVCTCGLAIAGQNPNGAMVVHTDNGVTYTAGENYCSTATYPLPTSCENLNTSSDSDPSSITVLWFLAAFPQSTSPCVVALEVGIHHNLAGSDFVAYGPCGPTPYEMPDAQWPRQDGTGSAMVFSSGIQSRLFAFYWFAVYHADASSFVGTQGYPGEGGNALFADCQIPAQVDYCAKFGTLRWGPPGQNQCPDPIGVCCLVDGTCTLSTQANCQGTYMGEGSICNPNPCPQPTGACCYSDGSCVMTLAVDCTGQWLGYGSVCDPNPCEQPPMACCFPADGHCEFMTEALCMNSAVPRRATAPTASRTPARSRTWPAASPTEAACGDGDLVPGGRRRAAGPRHRLRAEPLPAAARDRRLLPR